MPNRRPTDPSRPRPKSTVLVIRITPEDRALVEAAAAAHELETSTWARQTLVLAAKRWRAHEPTPPSAPPAAPAAVRDPRPNRPRDAG